MGTSNNTAAAVVEGFGLDRVAVNNRKSIDGSDAIEEPMIDTLTDERYFESVQRRGNITERSALRVQRTKRGEQQLLISLE